MTDPLTPSAPAKLSEPEKSVSRRDFLSWVIRGGLLAACAGVVLPALQYLLPVMRSGPTTGAKEVGSLEEIPLGGSKKVILAGSAILLVRTASEVKALSAICQHL